jgi:hypothetical protein
VFHVRVIAPASESGRVLQLFEAATGATNVVHQPDYARRPAGDLVAADVAREDASVLLADLQELGIDRDGAVTVIPIEIAISREADEIRARGSGSSASAVVWGRSPNGPPSGPSWTASTSSSWPWRRSSPPSAC